MSITSVSTTQSNLSATSGNEILVVNGGNVTSTTVENGGSLVVSSGGIASNTTVESGGTFILSAHNGATTNAVLSSGGTLELATATANFAGSLTFAGGSNTLDIAAVANTGSGVSAATISGFSSTDKIDVTVFGGAAALSFASATNEQVTVSSTSGSETFTFSNAATYSSTEFFLAATASGTLDLEYNAGLVVVGSGQSSTGNTATSASPLYVQSGGTIVSATVQSGGIESISGGTDSAAIVSSGDAEAVQTGSATGDQIYGALYTMSGGAAVLASETVEAGGTLFLNNGNSANATTVLSGGLFFISGANGAVTGTVLSGGGTLELDSPKANISGSVTFAGGGNTLLAATSASAGFGDLATISGFSSTDKVDVRFISAGATLSFTPTTSTTSITVSGSGGSETFIFSGLGYDKYTMSTVADGSGGFDLDYNPNFTVSSGQTSSGITVYSGQALTVQSGGTVNSTIIQAGGSAIVSGTDISATVSSGGTEIVSAGGSASGDQIFGSVTVSGTGATVTSETVFGGGELIVGIGGSASSTSVQDNGTLLISGAGLATDTVLSGGGTVDFTTSDAAVSGSLTFVGGGNTLEAIAIASAGDGDLAVISGFTSTDKIDVTVISAAGATLSFGTSGGNEVATISGLSGGVAVTESLIFSGTTTYDNFTLSLTSDGSGGVDLEYSPGVTTLTVSSGQNSSGLTVADGETLIVQSGGTVSATVVDNGGVEIVSGTDTSATISAGGTETVSAGGSATGDQIHGTATVSGAGATVTSETVFNGGQLNLTSAGIATSTTISSGGIETISAGSATGDQIYGSLTFEGGGVNATNETVYSGGSLVISGHSTATDTTVISGGTVDLATGSATLSGSLTFEGGNNTLVVAHTPTSSATNGEQATISGFSSTDRIDVTILSAAVGSSALFFGLSEGSEDVTVSGTAGSETLIFSGTTTYTISTLAVVSSGGHEYVEYSTSGFASGGTTTSVTTSTSSGAYTETSGNTLLVLGGGSVSAATIENGAFLTVSGGADTSATISSGGTETVAAGSATGDLIYGTISTISGGTGVFTNETVENGGTFNLLNGNSAAGTTVLSGGLFFLSGANGAVTGTVLSGGGTLELDSPKANISGSLTFAGGGNTLEAAVSGSAGEGDLAVISGFSSTDKIDVRFISATGATLSFAPNNLSSTTSVTVSGTGGSEKFIFSGLAYDSFTLSTVSDGSGGVDLEYTPGGTALTVSSGQTSTGITFGAGQTLTVQSGGTVNSTIVETGGSAIISGADHSATIWSGGSVTVYRSATGDQISGGVTVSGAGASVTSETVDSGGTLSIGSGAIGSATTVSISGTEIVSAGSATGDQIFGTLSAVSGAAGMFTSETVHSGGTFDLYAGNSATDTTVLSNGTLFISGAGSATDTVLSGGGTVDLATSDATLSGMLAFAGGSNSLEADAIASAGDGDLAVINGFTSTDKIDVTVISATGATLSFGTIGPNESVTINGSSGGSAVTESFVFSGTTTYNGATLSLTSDGSGGVDLVYIPAPTSVTVSSGQTSTGLFVADGETLTVQSGGTISATTIEFGGAAIVSGVDQAAIISAGGSASVYGSASGDQTFGGVTVSGAGATVASETVYSGGALTIESSSIDSATTVLAGGSETVSAGSATAGQIYGGVTVEAGGVVSSETVHNGGTLVISASSIDSYSTVIAGGSERVFGTATGDQIYGVQQVAGAGAVSGETVQDGATLAISGSAAASNAVLNGGGRLDLESPTAVLSGSLTFENGGNTLIATSIASSGDGDTAVISGFSATDKIVVSGVGSGATLSFATSGGNELVTVSGSSGAETFIFVGTTAYTSATMSLVTSGGTVDLETSFATSDFNILPYDSSTAGTISAGPLALFAVPVDDIAPTQLNEGFAEVDAKAAAYDLFTNPTEVEADLIGDIEPVVIGPNGQLYLLDGHHTFTALEDSIWGAEDPTVYVNVIANYSTDTEQQFIAQMEANNFLLPLNNGVPQTVDPNSGAPIPTTLTGLTSDVYRGLEYSILKQKDSKIFTTTNNIAGADGVSTPGLDKMPGLYSDFAEAAAYQDADGGLGLPYLSPGDIAIATDWNLNGDSITTYPNVSGTVHAYQLPGFILSQNITISQSISNVTLGNASPGSMEGAIDGNGTFTGITEINAGTVANPIYIDTPNIGLIMQVGNDNGFSVILTNDDNTYSGGTTFLAGRLIIAGDGSLGAAPTETLSAFYASLTLDSEGFPDNVTAAVQADNGIIFNSLSEGNGTLTIGTTAGEYTSESPFTTNRPIAVGNEAATIDVNGSYIELNGPLVTLGYDNLGLGETGGFPAFTIDDLSSGGGATSTAGKLILSTPSPDFFGDIIIGNTGTPTVEVMSDAALGNTNGPAEQIGDVELNGGTLQTGASFAAPERDIDVIGGSQIDLDGNTTSWGTLTDVKRTIAIVNSSATPAAITFNNLVISQTSILQLDGTANGTAYSGSETVTFTNGIDRTAAQDTLVLNASSSGALGTIEKVFSSGASTQLVDGIAPVWIVTNEGNPGGAGAYDFVTYGANGYVQENSGVPTLSSGTGSSVVELSADFSASGAVAAYALNTNGHNVSLNSNTLTIGDGTHVAGLILGSGNITGGTLAFGTSQGVIWLDGSDPTISAEITGSGGLTFAGSGAVTISEAAAVSGVITLDSGTVTLSASNVFVTDVAGVELGDVKSHPAASTLDITADNTFTTLNSVGKDSAINLSNGATLTIGDTTNNLSSTLSSSITESDSSVAGALTFDGSGLFDLSGMSTGKLNLVSGSTIVVNNTAQLRVDTSEFANSGIGIDLNGVGTQLQFALGGGDGPFANAITGTGELHLIGGTLQLTGTGNTYSGGTVLELGSTLDLTTANVSTGNADITDAGGLVVFDQDSAGTYSGVISDGRQMGIGSMASGSLDIDDSAGTTDAASGNDVTLGAVQTYTGATYVEAGTLTLGVVNAISDSNGVTLGRVGGAVDSQTANLVLEADNTLTSLSDDASNTTSVVLNGHVLTLTPTSSNPSTFGGVIEDGTGAGSLVVDGGGTVTLNGINTYTGATTVESGTLIVNGSVADSAIQVESGGTIGGTGTVGAVTVDSGGTFAPSDPAQFTVASLSLTSGANFDEQIAGTSAGAGGYDQTIVGNGGTVSLGNATLDLSFDSFQASVGQVFEIIDNEGSSAVSGSFNGLAQGATFEADGDTFQISYTGGTGNDVTLTVMSAGQPARADFYGNGTSNVLFRSDGSGDTGFYRISDGANTGWVDIGGSSTAYSVVGTGDFTGNGTDDILYRDNSTGDTGFYAISNGVLTGWQDIGASSTAYSVVGTGNFLGNGTDDALYRDNSTGDTGFYAISNGVNTGWHDLGASSTAYSVVGTGDFLGNGIDDVLYRDNSTGDTGFYAISNGVNAGWHDVGGSSTAYSVVGTGDFLGNGTDDILYRDNSTGDFGFYAISNGVLTGWHDLGGSATAYSVVAVGDYLGNGTDDILFRDNSTGDTGFYAISNGVNTGWHDIGGSSTAYHVVG
jgi:autotransporter-associated beta strand protein/autotransporter passenger strand-loop-strand repeat protein